jgi:hypothetical protein
MVDVEGEKKAKAKKAIRDSMSPPGSMRLHPQLEAHRQKFGIPDGVFRAIAGNGPHSRLPHRPLRR